MAEAFTPPPTKDDVAEASTITPTREATAQVTKPCAVSGKNTSSRCVPTHLVRNRPAMKPPRPEEIHGTSIRRMRARGALDGFCFSDEMHRGFRLGWRARSLPRSVRVADAPSRKA